ncbi:MAG: cytochrome c [Chloroflexi bacterium]|nr:cytochrome c [Chloroflexota bacterium]
MKISDMTRIAGLNLLIMLALSACGAGSQATPTDPPPTATPFPTFAFVEPTKPPVFAATTAPTPATEATADGAIALNPKSVDRGRGRYEALDCASCHGENGEGIDGEKSLLDFALSEDDFITFMRSGGALGTDHQFSTDRLSNSGSRNLYQYLVSLARSG